MITPPRMLASDQLDRRSAFKGLSLDTGAVILQPFLKALAAEARGETSPKADEETARVKLRTILPTASFVRQANWPDK